MPRPVSNALRVAALLLATVAACVVASELVVRLRYGGKFGPRPAFYTSDLRLGWKPAADLHHTFYGPDFETAIRTDTDGYRLGALGPVDYEDDVAILIGDSYAFGWGVSTEQSFASYLDERLSSRANGQMRIVNLGVGGYGTFQECTRLTEFFRRHDDAKPRLVILQHSINDATDNVGNMGYYFGDWQTEPLPRERSRIHLINLARYLREAKGSEESRRARRASEAYREDLLWGFRRTVASSYPDTLRFGSNVLLVDADQLSTEINAESLAYRKQLTYLQRVLMLEALHCVHKTARARGVPVVHIFIPTTPAWYVDQVSQLVRASADSTHCVVANTGAIPQPEAFAGSLTNPHSGKHFNPEFNRFWAEAVASWLDGSGLVENRRPTE